MAHNVNAMPQVGDRLPPFSAQAEQGILGCILLDPKACLIEAIETLGSGEVFYDLRHQALFDLLVEMYERNELIDLITVQQYLKDRKQLEALGGMPYIAGLLNCVPSAANLEYYAEIVREKHSLRRLIQVCTGAVARAYDGEGEPQQLLDTCGKEIVEVCESATKVKSQTIKSFVQAAIEQIEASHGSGGKPLGITTGLADLDKMTGGLRGGEVFVIGGRPSEGKSSLAMNIAEHVACESRIPSGIFSIEMSGRAIVMRMICSRARVNLRSVADGFLTERDFPKLTVAAAKISTAPLFIDDSSGLTLMQFRARARRLFQQHKVRLFVIDYFQKMHSGRRVFETQRQDLGYVAKGIKEIANELDVPIILIASLNREKDKDGKRKPRLSDLKECGDLEYEADIVGLLYKPERDDDENDNADCIPVNLLIAKQREGPTGDVHLTFLRKYTRFESASRVGD